MVAALAFAGQLSAAETAADWKPAGDKIKTKFAESVTPENVWQEYPRPQMVRENWQNLNGLWQYAVLKRPTPASSSAPDKWNGDILVPFCIESSLSGVQRLLEPSEELWYQRTFNLKKKDHRHLLHFEAVDYECTAWVNGTLVGTHKGGNTPFSFDITDAAVEGENTISVKVIDETEKYQLLGKQSRRPGGIWYTRVSGIWQTVWLESVPQSYIRRIKIDTTIAPAAISVKTFVNDAAVKASGVKVTAFYEGKEVASATGSLENTVLSIKDAQLWTPDTPHLYELKVELVSGKDILDSVESYTGLRTVGKIQDEAGNWRYTLNGKEIFHLGPLDQGWFPDGLLTPASNEAMRFDIDYLKAAGFNCIRNHIKVRPRRYYAHCDKVGMMVWQDQVSGSPHASWNGSLQPYRPEPVWPEAAHQQFMYELKDMIDYLYNYPSIVSWVPFNEGWAQHNTVEVVKWTVAYDPTRLVNGTSGGNFYPVGDVADIHQYPHPKFPTDDPLLNDYIKVVGEYGGHGFFVPKYHRWNQNGNPFSYGQVPQTLDELLERYKESARHLLDLKRRGIAGGIYTQTSDVENEINGLMSYDRKFTKIPAEILKKIHAPLYKKLGPLKTIIKRARANKVHVRYTTTKPAKDWMKPEFTANNWAEGPAGIGSRDTPGTFIKTEWTTPNIWIRSSFSFDPGEGSLMLDAFWDENATVYINGVQAAKLDSFTTGYRVVNISPEAQAALKKGKNTLAVHCQNASGGQYIDVSLVYENAK